MFRIFNKYKTVSGLILLSLIIALLAPEGSIKSFFIGLGTSAAMVSFGNSLMEIKNKKSDSYITTFDDE